MADPDLIAFAKAAGSAGDDLFSLLSVDATASEQDIRRAFRKKALTAHPDKAGDKYDPALYEKLEKARDVLMNKEAREAYEAGMKAILQKRKQLEMMGEKRRRLVEDLEAREREAENQKKMKMTAGQNDAEEERWRREMVERGRRKMEERKRELEAAEQREREREEAERRISGEDKAETGEAGEEDLEARERELERKLEESRARKAAKKAAKKAKKGDKEISPSPTAPAGKAEPMADEEKVAAVPPPPFSDTPAPPQAVSVESSRAATSKPSDRFASTMARLRAAQAKKDEEKRKREAEAEGGAAV
ncbi:hypothetical protein QBC43DRAFT_313377 [Cladorrhinum sp. PSN259]|nr:hypothetical protein QBC43DRAFT_313377 [Cladorrhinum sp. PSN259]